MVLFPNAKINFGLNVIRKRDDGYNELESVFYPLGLKDGLEFVENKHNKNTFTSSGIPLDVDPADNIVVKACNLLTSEHSLPGLDIHLHKVIPFGAGLGGGSSDAAFLLKGLNSYFKLGLSVDKLKAYALRLGADCSFFIENKPSFVTGIGEKLQALDFSLAGYFLVLVKPPFGVGTKEAYAGIVPSTPEFKLSNAIFLPSDQWQECVINDFETSVFQKFPFIAEIKSFLLAKGATYASMSGSGSSVFGLFKNEPEIGNDDFPKDYFIWKHWL